MVELIMKNISRYLSILFPLTIAIGVGYYFVTHSPLAGLSLLYLAFVYMPAPFYSLLLLRLIYKEKVEYSKFLSIKTIKIKDILFTIGIFLTWVVSLFVLTIILGIIAPDIFGKLVTTNAELLEIVTKMVGPELAKSAKLPPTPFLLIPIGLVGAIVSGFTINMIFALGEEIAWRGYLWTQLKDMPFFKKHLLIGGLWGLWHAPVIIQGYNYGTDYAWLGVIFFILFCAVFSLLFGVLIEKTGNALYAAVLHGMFNGFAGIFVIMIINYNPFIGGGIGIVSMLAILLSFALLRFSQAWTNNKMVK